LYPHCWYWEHIAHQTSNDIGTSACPNGVFYCENKGHIPAYIKSYRVNDGVCDPECCDGSDETSGLIKCANICKEVGIQYRKHKAEMDAILNSGASTKREWIEYGKSKMADLQTQKAKLEEQIAIMRTELGALEKVEEVARAKEQAARESSISSNSEKPTSKCPPCKSSSDSAILKIGSLRNHIKNLQDEVDELLTILHDMKRDHNQNYHDMAVKTAISGYDEFLVEYDTVKAERQEDVNDEDFDEQIDIAQDGEHDFTNEAIEENTDPVVKEATEGNYSFKELYFLI
jgi:protein kinase C substrate 80K-H